VATTVAPDPLSEEQAYASSRDDSPQARIAQDEACYTALRKVTETMTQKRLALIVGIVVLASALSAIVAYHVGYRRASPLARSSSASAEMPEGPCVPFREAGPLVGQSACITGRVLRVFTSRAGNTFLDFCPDYRTCPFTSVVFSQDRAKFGDLGQLQGRRIEIRGLVSSYQDRAEIIIRDPGQIRLLP